MSPQQLVQLLILRCHTRFQSNKAVRLDHMIEAGGGQLLLGFHLDLLHQRGC
ncbi:hypothetical protein EXN66_Car008270 [Channa argus]|uniref:Uncharacterized protein n=1 Tax=Channa argus TaxID=215402 RepID=A0A6G1PR26_CHAAH|nr:hypothetical protein EXN66_Car008270 [Channa argus]